MYIFYVGVKYELGLPRPPKNMLFTQLSCRLSIQEAIVWNGWVWNFLGALIVCFNIVFFRRLFCVLLQKYIYIYTDTWILFHVCGLSYSLSQLNRLIHLRKCLCLCVCLFVVWRVFCSEAFSVFVKNLPLTYFGFRGAKILHFSRVANWVLIHFNTTHKTPRRQDIYNAVFEAHVHPNQT